MNRGPLSRLRDLRGRLASWPAAPLHDSPESDSAGALGSAPADAVTPSHSESLAQLVESTPPTPTPSEAETTAIDVPSRVADGAGEAETQALPVATPEPDDAEAPADDSADPDESTDTEASANDDKLAASPLRTVGPVSTTPSEDEESDAEDEEPDEAETTVLPVAARPSADETTVIPVAPRLDAAEEPDETAAAEALTEDESSDELEPVSEETAAEEPRTEPDEPETTALPVAVRPSAEETTAIPVADRPTPDQAVIDTEQNELPDATPPTEMLPLAPLPAQVPAPLPVTAEAAAVTASDSPTERQSPEYFAPSTPQAPTKRGGKLKWILAAAIAAVVLIVAAIALLVPKSSDGGSSAADPRRAASEATTTFVDAVNRGDLAALRQQTCGNAKAYYDGLNEAQWQRIHDNAKTDGLLPELDGLQAVDVKDERAEVQVQVHYAGQPDAKVSNTLSLENDGGTWKVCTRVGAR